MNRIQAIADYLNEKGWVTIDDPEEQVRLVGASLTNENYVVSQTEIYGETKHFFRVSLESAMGLTDPAEYEFYVLQCQRKSRVTPRPYYVDGEVDASLGMGAMFMEYLPGRRFTYAGDYELAARTLAAVHAQPADGLLTIANPVGEAARQCDEAVSNVDSRSGVMVSGMKKCVEELEWLADKVDRWLPEDSPVIVHGTPGESEFIVDEAGERAWLVDWECATISSRYVDLGRFLLLASHAGESGHCRDETEKRRFLEAYADASEVDVSIDVMLERAEIFARAAKLWNSSWTCAAFAR